MCLFVCLLCVACCLLLVVCCWLFVAGCCGLVVGCRLSIVSGVWLDVAVVLVVDSNYQLLLSMMRLLLVLLLSYVVNANDGCGMFGVCCVLCVVGCMVFAVCGVLWALCCVLVVGLYWWLALGC